MCIIKDMAFVEVDHTNNKINLRRCVYSEIKDSYDIETFLNFNKEQILSAFNSISDPIRGIAGKNVPCDHICNVSNIKRISIQCNHYCNLRCYHCCARSSIKNLHSKEILCRLILLFRGIFPIIEFDGCGEALLFYKDIIKILKLLKKEDYQDIRIWTNGTTLNDNKILELKQIEDQTGVNYTFLMSIDGCTKDTYESSRVGANFERVINNAKNIYTTFGKDHLIVAFTAKKTNLYDIPYIKAFFNKNFPGSQQWITKDLLNETITNETIKYYNYKNRIIIDRLQDKILLKRACQLDPQNVLSFDNFYNYLKKDIYNLKKIFNRNLNLYNKDNYKSYFSSKENLEKFFNYHIDNMESLDDIDYIELGTLVGCNLKCYHCCSGDEHHYDISDNDKYYYKLLDLFVSSDIHLKDFLIGTNGEVFMEKEKLLPYLEKVDGNKIKQISFISNLTFLDKNYLQQLKNISIKNNYNILLICSIDGISKETYEAIRIGANFEKTMHIFADAVSILGPNSIKVNYVRKKPNEKESDTDIKEFFNLYGVKVDILKDLRAIDEANQREIPLTQKESKLEIQDEKVFCANNKNVLTLYLAQDLKTLQVKRCCYLEPIMAYDINNVPSLKEIINLAEKAEYLKVNKTIKNLPKGCKYCSSLGKINQIRFDISHACNLNCYHCCEGERHIDTDDSKRLYFRLLKESIDLCESIQFTAAGEPFSYYTEIISFLASLKNHKVKTCSFVTNLTLLNNQKINQLKEVSKKTNVNYNFLVSIDGFEKESFEKTRCGANWDIFLKNLKYILKVFNNVTIGFTNKKINDDQMAHIEEFCKMFNIKNYIIHYDSLEEWD